MTNAGSEAFRTIGPSAAITDNDAVPYYVHELKRRVSIARVGGKLYAFDDLCPCAPQPCPLSGGLLAGTTIMCQCHGSRFDLATGTVVRGPASEPLRVHGVREVEGTVQLRLDAPDRARA